MYGQTDGQMGGWMGWMVELTSLKGSNAGLLGMCKNCYDRTSSITDMIQQLKWCSLQYRHRGARLCMLYKIYYNLVTISADYVQLQQRHTHFSHLLSFHTLQSSSDYKYVVFPRSICEWNLLPSNVKCQKIKVLNILEKVEQSGLQYFTTKSR